MAVGGRGKRPVKFRIGQARLRAGQTRTPTGGARSTARKDFERVERQIQRLINTLENATPDAIEYALDPIYARSQELVPVDKGVLQDSAFIEVRRTTSGFQGTVGYAQNGYPDYAIFVHENLEHFHEPPTQAKFLQRAVEEHLSDIPGRLREFLRLE